MHHHPLRANLIIGKSPMRNQPNSIDELVTGLRNGDQSVLSELFSHYRERLRRTVDFRLDQRLRSRVDVSDVLQEVLLSAVERVDHFVKQPQQDLEPSTAFFIWLRQCAVQRIIDLHRHHMLAQKRDTRRELKAARPSSIDHTSTSLAFHLVGQIATPSQIVSKLELMERVQNALNEINETDREVLALRHFEELSNNEVAEVLGISKAGASNRYVRALDRLRTILDEIPDFFG